MTASSGTPRSVLSSSGTVPKYGGQDAVDVAGGDLSWNDWM